MKIDDHKVKEFLSRETEILKAVLQNLIALSGNQRFERKTCIKTYNFRDNSVKIKETNCYVDKEHYFLNYPHQTKSFKKY